MNLQTGHTAKVGASVRQLYRRARATGDGQTLGIGNRLVDDAERGTALLARLPAPDRADRCHALMPRTSMERQSDLPR